MLLVARLLTALTAVLLLTQCTAPRRSSSDPFAGGGGSSRENGGSVRGVRILVDGETAAEAGCGGCDPTATQLGNPRQAFTVETVVPR